MHSQSASRCTPGLLHFLEMWCCSPGYSGSQSGDLKAPTKGLRTGTQALCHQSKLCAPSLPPGAHQASCTSWRPSMVAQAVQILKQRPEGSHLGPAGLTRAHWLLPAGRPEVPLASCRTWRCGVAAQADLDPEEERSLGSSQRPQDWNPSSVPPERGVRSQTASGCTPGLPHFLETE